VSEDRPGQQAERRRLREEAERRRRLAAVFGDVLPETTADERSPGASSDEASAIDRWLREQVPPHHG
jgi:hypothetical protein